ncbi:NAD-dependent epimerase/dehydratase family protein [Bacteroides sp. AN502(2024)]|uniref:GDP-mannose 4,6-dehydratase n=1 Tax=Bacteroides sp. AN502(2024) TaxID=3160599 RepID=UPI003510D3C7
MGKTTFEKTVIITGIAGFIGFHLTKRLLRENPNLQIVGIDNMNDYYDVALKEYRLNELSKYKNFRFVRGDVADKDTIMRLFDNYNLQTVVHLAAQAGVRYSITNPDVYISSNVIGFHNLLEACRHSCDNGHSGVTHFVYASSSSVYGLNRRAPFTTVERTDSPVSLYAATKKADELMAHAYSQLYNIPTTGLRFFTVYGPAGRPDMAYFDFTNKFVAGETVRIFNHGHCLRDFTYINDVVESIVRIMSCPPQRVTDTKGISKPPYSIYNVGAGSPVSLLEFVETLQEELIAASVLPSGFDFDAHKQSVPMQPGDMLATYADTSDLERQIGFKPSTSLRDGLRNFAQWYADYYKKN